MTGGLNEKKQILQDFQGRASRDGVLLLKDALPMAGGIIIGPAVRVFGRVHARQGFHPHGEQVGRPEVLARRSRGDRTSSGWFS